MKRTVAVVAVIVAIGVLTVICTPSQTSKTRTDLSWMDIYTLNQWSSGKLPFIGCPHLMFGPRGGNGRDSTVQVENPTLWSDPMQQIKDDLDQKVANHRNAVAANSRLNGHRIIE